MVKENVFKQTEIGLIPEEWDVFKLDSLTVKSGLIRGPFGGALKKEFFVNEGYKVYEQKNAIYKNIELGEYFIDKSKFDELKRFEVQHNDFILSCSGTIGKLYRIPFNHKKGIINQALLIIRLNNDLINYSFFEHIFNDERLQNKIIDDTQGGAMKNLVGMSEFRKTQIPLPPLPEQQAIAEALSDADAWIESLEQLIAKKRLLKQGAMQELLTPKEDWEVKKLGEVFRLKQGVQCAIENQYMNEKFGLKRFIRIVDLTQKEIEKRFINDPGVEHHIEENDLFMVRYGAPGVIGYGFKGVIANNLFRLIPKEDLINKYFKFLFEFIKPYIEEISSSSTMAALNFTTLNNIELSFPKSKEEQTRIATILSDMDAELEALEAQLAKAQQIKQGMMQELLTGRVRLV